MSVKDEIKMYGDFIKGRASEMKYIIKSISRNAVPPKIKEVERVLDEVVDQLVKVVAGHENKDISLCDRACITTQRCSGNCAGSLEHSSMPSVAVDLNTLTKPWNSLKSNPTLLAALKDARQPTSQELRQQLIGVIAAEVGVSKERVEDVLGFKQETHISAKYAIIPVEPTPEIIQAMAKAWQDAVAGDDENECVAEYKAAVVVAQKLIPQDLQQLKHHEIRELINSLTEVAREYHNTQQLRERICGLVLSALKST